MQILLTKASNIYSIVANHASVCFHHCHHPKEDKVLEGKRTSSCIGMYSWKNAAGQAKSRLGYPLVTSVYLLALSKQTRDPMHVRMKALCAETLNERKNRRITASTNFSPHEQRCEKKRSTAVSDPHYSFIDRGEKLQ